MSPSVSKQPATKNEAPVKVPEMLGVITWEAHRKEVEAGWRAGQTRKRPVRQPEKPASAGSGE